MDVLTPEQRRYNMSRIKGKNTKPELLIRRGLYARGFRYRLHSTKLPGRPDITFTAKRVAIFIHGCFWHDHRCPLCRIPATRRDFWVAKLKGNKERDVKAVQRLLQMGWRILTIWECALKGNHRRELPQIIERASRFISGSHSRTMVIQGKIASRR